MGLRPAWATQCISVLPANQGHTAGQQHNKKEFSNATNLYFKNLDAQDLICGFFSIMWVIFTLVWLPWKTTNYQALWYFLIENNFILYSVFWSCPPFPPRSSPTSHPANSTTSFSLYLENKQDKKKVRIKQNRKNEKGKTQSQKDTHTFHNNTKVKTIINMQKNKEGKNAQTKHYEAQQLQKYHWVPFVLAMYCWGWGLPFSVIDVTNRTPLEKPICPTWAAISWKTLLGQGWGLTSTSHLSGGTPPVQTLCVLPWSRWARVHVRPAVDGRRCFFGVFQPPLTLTILSPLLHSFPNPKKIIFKCWIFKSLTAQQNKIKSRASRIWKTRNVQDCKEPFPNIKRLPFSEAHGVDRKTEKQHR